MGQRGRGVSAVENHGQACPGPRPGPARPAPGRPGMASHESWASVGGARDGHAKNHGQACPGHGRGLRGQGCPCQLKSRGPSRSGSSEPGQPAERYSLTCSLAKTPGTHLSAPGRKEVWFSVPPGAGRAFLRAPSAFSEVTPPENQRFLNPVDFD